MNTLIARLMPVALIATVLVASVVSLRTEQYTAGAQAPPINPDLIERELIIARDGSPITHLTVEIADTAEAQRIGLMGRTELAADRGMLFVWEKPFRAAMWMKNTLIPLDFVFVRADGRIVWIVHNVPPCPPVGDCPGYGSPIPVSMVLEIGGGRAAVLGLRLGDRLVLVESP